jgi:hypothetical protein
MHTDGHVTAEPPPKIEVARDLSCGPIYHRLLHGHAPLNDRFVRDFVDRALGGLMPSATSAGRQAGHLP